MIKHLSIQNYALIERLEMDPSAKLNIITGETGAGKSIMLGAVGLLLGNRSDNKALLIDDRKCVIEGVFNIGEYKLQKLFDELELDYDDECIIRREISPAGKSRAFVNDTPAGLSTLKALGEHFLDVHSQHESLQLKERLYQLNVLDVFAAHPKLIANYQSDFQHYVATKKEYERLINLEAQSNEDADYKQFLLDELTQADLDELGQESLEEELEVLVNAEDIKVRLGQTQQLLDGEEISVLNLLVEIRSQLSPISNLSNDLNTLLDRVESQRLELQDLLNEVGMLADKTEHDPERIQEVKDRLDLLYRLQKKHNTIDVAQLVELRNQLSNELSVTQNLDKSIKKAKNELTEAEAKMMKSGELLRESRQLASLDLATEIEKIIHKIGIENGRIEIKIIPTSPSLHGIDLVEIQFSANKGIAPQDVSQVASGGEFSRLIFAIKYLIAGKTAMPTVIFDEIDTGVSGEVAIQMVNMMKEMAKNHQVIAISHLPQFAAGGDAHYFVYKDHSSDRSVSKIRKLESEDRITEIAKMIGGKQPTDAAFSSARELLGIS
jgi:DNA repair protein RecN (Recombination protein N)